MDVRQFIPTALLLRAYRAPATSALPTAVWRDLTVLAALESDAPRGVAAPVMLSLHDGADALLHLLDRVRHPVAPAAAQDLLRWQRQWPTVGPALRDLVQRVLPQQTPQTVGLLLELCDALHVLDNTLATASARTAALPLPALPQWLHQLQTVIAAQPQMPSATRAETDTILQLFRFAAQERPATFEHELFALPVLQRAGFNLTDYVATAARVDPMRLALLYVAAERHDPATIADLTHAVRATLQSDAAPDALASLLTQWEARLQPTRLTPIDAPSPAVAARVASDVSAPLVGVTPVSGDATVLIPLQAVSRQMGVLPAAAWTATLGNIPLHVLEWNGCAWMAGTAAARQRARIGVRTGAGHGTWMDVLAHWLRGFDEAPAESSPAARAADAYAQSADPVELSAPLFGAIDLSLATPMILTRRYHEQAIAAPLHVSFRFLADVVDPRTRYSRADFLRLAQSPGAQRFRAAVRALDTQGVAGYPAYIDALGALFAGLPCQSEALIRAQHFLRDEVLLHLMGKAAHRNERIDHLQRLPRGDLLASICATTAGALALQARRSDALLHFTDAAQLAQTRPYFLQQLEQFLQHLRRSADAAHSAYAPDLPMLPSATPQHTYAAASHLAEEFVHSVQIC